MSPIDEVEEDARVKLEESPFAQGELLFRAAEVKEQLGKLTETQLEVYAHESIPTLEDFLGKSFIFSILTEDDDWRQFGGICVAAERLGFFEGHWTYGLKLRPRLWILTRRRDNRVFQDMNVQDIINDVLERAGVKDNVEWKVSTSHQSRAFCLQYRETDFDFITRLMEEEGIYYHFNTKNGVQKLTFTDDSAKHDPIEGRSDLEFVDAFAAYGREMDHISEFKATERILTNKVDLRDYDFIKPDTELVSLTSKPTGKHSFKDLEDYDAPGHYFEQDLGDHYAKVRGEAHAWPYRVSRGICNVRTMSCGGKFTLDKHKIPANNREHTIISATHRIQARRSVAESGNEKDRDGVDEKVMSLPGRLKFPKGFTSNYQCEFETIGADIQYRSPRETRWPRIAGYLTAVVVGPEGEEIYCDEYGRVKVQFHWDRKGESDEKSSCWIRVVTPWSGQAWGMVHIPRVNQEVMVQFADGDPDRPIITGMLYKKTHMPPYELPTNKTQQGIKTNSSPGGEGFNELMFEDKKNEELVRFQSEKDYEHIVKNNATITIGVEKKDAGDKTQTIHNDVTETIGNDETRDIGNDITETVGNDETRTIGNDQNQTIGNDQTENIGNDQTLDVGSNQTVSVGQKITVDAGQKITMTAGQEILLKVGGSSIKIDNMGVEIKGPMVKVNANTMGEFKAGGILTLKGSLTLIN